jgi:hypothetical protein
MLDNEGSCASFFFLLGRIYCIDKAALKYLVQASGFVATWLRGVAALEVSIAGGKQGLDCVSAIFVRVCSVRVRGGLIVTCFTLLDLFVRVCSAIFQDLL